MFFQIFIVFASTVTLAEGVTTKGYVLQESSELTLVCNTSDNDRWRWFHGKQSRQSNIFDCKITSEDILCNKTVNDITYLANSTTTSMTTPSIGMNQAGNYTCQDDNLDTEILHEIIVVGNISINNYGNETNVTAAPVIDILKGDTLEFECLVDYKSSDPSVVQITFSSNNCENVDVLEMSRENKIICKNITESFLLTCSVTTKDIPGNSMAEQVEVRTHHCPQKIEFLGSVQQGVRAGDQLTCWVAAYPPVEVGWIHPQSANGLNQASIPIHEKGKYVCVVNASTTGFLGSCPALRETFEITNVAEKDSTNHQKSGCPTCKAGQVKSGFQSEQPTLCSIIVGFLFCFKSFDWLL